MSPLCPCLKAQPTDIAISHFFINSTLVRGGAEEGILIALVVLSGGWLARIENFCVFFKLKPLYWFKAYEILIDSFYCAVSKICIYCKIISNFILFVEYHSILQLEYCIIYSIKYIIYICI